MLRAGEDKRIAKLKKLVDFDQDESLRFQHCGKMVKQLSNGTVELSQAECATNIKPIPTAPSRKRLRSEQRAPVEVSMLRGRYGSRVCSGRRGQTCRSRAQRGRPLSGVDQAGLFECNKVSARAHQ